MADILDGNGTGTRGKQKSPLIGEMDQKYPFKQISKYIVLN